MFTKRRSEQIRGKNAANLLGKTFGLLKVIKRLPNKNNRTMWLCECSCKDKNKVEVDERKLTTGNVSSCGCLKKSLGEYKISKILEKNKIPFKHNIRFTDCKFKDSNYYAYFDFFVNSEYVIEYDGEQHFNPCCFNGIKNVDAKKNYQKTVEHDKFKNEYCFKNNIPIIRIPYTYLKEITLSDLMLDTSQYILKEVSY